MAWPASVRGRHLPLANQTEVMNTVLGHLATGHATVDDLCANECRVALNVSHSAYPTYAFTTPSGKIELVSQRAAVMAFLRCHSRHIFVVAKAISYWRMVVYSRISIPFTITRVRFQLLKPATTSRPLDCATRRDGSGYLGCRPHRTLECARVIQRKSKSDPAYPKKYRLDPRRLAWA